MPEKKDDITKSLDELRGEVRELKAIVRALYAMVLDGGMGFEDEAPVDELSGLHLMLNEDDFSM